MGWVYAAPALLLVAMFFLLPLLGTIWTSLHDWPLYGPHKFLGLANYVKAFSDPYFWSAVWFTFRFMVVTLVIGTLLAFALALLVSQPRPGVGFFRTAIFLPVTMGYAAAGYLCFYMLDGKVGVINNILIQLGITEDPVRWLTESSTSFWAIAIMTVWKSVGFAMIIFLIGINAIPDELFEAQRVDGANRWQIVRHLTIPMLRMNTSLVIILSVVGGMLTFDQFYTTTKGGPRGETVTAVYQIYANAFDYQKLGYGSALSVVLLGLLAIVSAIQLSLFRSKS